MEEDIVYRDIYRAKKEEGEEEEGRRNFWNDPAFQKISRFRSRKQRKGISFRFSFEEKRRERGGRGGECRSLSRRGVVEHW